MQGFHSWTVYKKKLTKLQQFYDFTYHLYKKEHNEIIQLRKQQKETYTTSINSITHSVNCLLIYTNDLYPQKLQELVLISLISSTEKFLIDLIKECFYRDKNPFKNSQIIEFQKSELFTFSSLPQIEEKILKKELRQITSGGIKIARKYYKNTFNIDFGDLGINLDLFFEFFDTRHLFVHSEGFIDEMYVKTYKKR